MPKKWLWHGRHVKLVDGSTCSMPDTEANQAEYPQPTSQAAGLGFPLARFVVLLSLATAMVSDLAIGPYSGKETGESALLRELLERLNPGDILLADRYFCSYFMVCLLLAAKVDFVTRLHQRRTADFRRGTRLGAGDHVVVWSRPDKPEWMDQATYEQMPQSIELREVEVAVAQPGFRTEVLVVVTTLTDARRYTRGDIAELYHRRWLAELDIRAIKISMGMDVLRAKSPEMARRELWTCLLAYNLIRQTLLASAQHADRSPRQLSFTAAMQKIAAGWITVVLLDDDVLAVLIESHWDDLAKHKIGHRPNRIEPRAIKRRPKPHDLLMEPRDQARANCSRAKCRNFKPDNRQCHSPQTDVRLDAGGRDGRRPRAHIPSSGRPQSSNDRSHDGDRCNLPFLWSVCFSDRVGCVESTSSANAPVGRCRGCGTPTVYLAIRCNEGQHGRAYCLFYRLCFAVVPPRWHSPGPTQTENTPAPTN